VLPEESVAPLYAFCGIGNPDGFLLDLQKWGLPLAGHRTFRDHYRYNFADAEALEASALEAGARALVTTEKDARNLGNARFSCLPVYLAVISLEIPDDKEFFSLVKSKLPAPRGEAA